MYYRKWVEFVLAIFVILVMCKLAFATEAVYERYRPNEVVGWSVYAADDDLSTSATLLTDEDTSFAQLSAADELEILSSSVADTTQTVTVYGINSDGKKCSESFAVTGTTVALGTTVFSYIDYVEIDIECAGTITVQKEDDTDITVIPIGSLSSQVSQHFNGEKRSFITYWTCGVNTTTANVTFTLRWYPDDADSLDSTDGFRILDSIFIDGAVTSPYNVTHNYEQPIICPKGGWIAVFAIGSADNGDGYTLLQGYDVN